MHNEIRNVPHYFIGMGPCPHKCEINNGSIIKLTTETLPVFPCFLAWWVNCPHFSKTSAEQCLMAQMSFWRNFHHWLQPVMTILSKWQYFFCFSVSPDACIAIALLRKLVLAWILIGPVTSESFSSKYKHKMVKYLVPLCVQNPRCALCKALHVVLSAILDTKSYINNRHESDFVSWESIWHLLAYFSQHFINWTFSGLSHLPLANTQWTILSDLCKMCNLVVNLLEIWIGDHRFLTYIECKGE